MPWGGGSLSRSEGADLHCKLADRWPPFTSGQAGRGTVPTHNPSVSPPPHRRPPHAPVQAAQKALNSSPGGGQPNVVPGRLPRADPHSGGFVPAARPGEAPGPGLGPGQGGGAQPLRQTGSGGEFWRATSPPGRLVCLFACLFFVCLFVCLFSGIGCVLGWGSVAGPALRWDSKLGELVFT